MRLLTSRPLICFYAFVRTTVELPPELMKQAKARAAAQGESLKSLLTRAVSSELGKSRGAPGSSNRVRLPLFGNSRRKPVGVTSADIARVLAESDLAEHGRATRTRKK
jgi:hypothetical protein